MHVTRLFGSRLPRQNFCERGLSLHQLLQGGLDVVERFEMVHALGASAKFAGSLRTAEEKDAEYGGFGAGEVEDFLGAVLVLGDAAVSTAGGAGQPILLKAVECVTDGILVELHHGT